MNFRKIAWPVFAALCLTGGSYLATVTSPWSTPTAVAQSTTAKPTPLVQPELSTSANDMSRAFRAVHDVVKDSVVNIDTSRKVARNRLRGRPFPFQLPPELQPDNPDEEGDTPPGAGGGAGPKQLIPYGTGSGVIVSPDGYILTNNHVVENADQITVRFDDNRELKAKVIGTDPKTDLAVIKIDADRLTYAKFGDSDALDVGDWVLAFGSPFGFDQTMTQGIISAKGREIRIIEMNNPALQGLTYENFLQTDAAINPGNSGGPLVNLKGEIVGINTAIASRSGAYNGIGFSIPSNDAKYIFDSIINSKDHKVVRGYLGVEIGNIHDPKYRDNVKNLGYTGTSGVLIAATMADSPGAKGGLKPDDIITAINGKKVETTTDLRSVIARTAPGNKVTLSVFRGGKTLEIPIAVGTQPDKALGFGRPTPENPAEPSAFGDLGITVAETPKGLTIAKVDPDGVAAEQGLRKGDVILRAQGKDIKTTDDLQAALGKTKLSDGIRLAIRSPDGTERSLYFRKAAE